MPFKSKLSMVNILIFFILLLLSELYFFTNISFILYFFIPLLLFLTYAAIMTFGCKWFPSLYNPIGFIQLHVGNKNKKNKYLFFKICADTILRSKKNKKDVIFFTNHVSAKTLKKKFDCSIYIKEPGPIQKLFILFTVLYQDKKDKKDKKLPFISCYIKTELMKDETINWLQKYTTRDRSINIHRS